MGSGWNNERPRNSAQYTPNQVSAVLRNIGVEVAGETNNDFLCYCPYHGNVHTPSFNVSKTKGSYICFNAACNEMGSLVELVKFKMRKNDFEAIRFILKKGSETKASFEEELKKALIPQVDFVPFPQEPLDRMYDDFWNNKNAQSYMFSRGFEQETLKEFRIGFSEKKNMIVVPMHSPKGIPIGVIGRSASENNKAFKNSKQLPTSKTLWNLHRAKRFGNTIIICEASFDAMRIHQAGYPNVVACLGGFFSKFHFELIQRHFDNIIIMTDYDKKENHVYKDCRKCSNLGFMSCQGHNPGRELGETIAAGLHRKNVMWASCDYGIIYPHEAKDAGDMTDDEIRSCIKNAVSNFEYNQWSIDC